MRAKADTSGDPQLRAQGGRGRLCLLCRRGSPPQPLPPAPRRALHSPGFPSGPARLGSCQGTELTFASREFQLAADQISGRARLSGHRGGAAPPPPRRAKRAPDGNKDEDAAPPASLGRRGGEKRPRREQLPTGGRGCAPSPARLGSHAGAGVYPRRSLRLDLPPALRRGVYRAHFIPRRASWPPSPRGLLLPSLISSRAFLDRLRKGDKTQQKKETEVERG